MAYKLGKRSRKRLEGMHPDLVRVVKRAIKISKVDFTVIKGRRSIKRQRQLVRKGASRTMRSRHLTATPSISRLGSAAPCAGTGCCSILSPGP